MKSIQPLTKELRKRGFVKAMYKYIPGNPDAFNVYSRSGKHVRTNSNRGNAYIVSRNSRSDRITIEFDIVLNDCIEERNKYKAELFNIICKMGYETHDCGSHLDVILK